MKSFDFNPHVQCALLHAEGLGCIDEELEWAAAIHLYTQETPLYKKLNTLLRDHGRSGMEPFLPYLKLLLHGLYQLPLENITIVYRGVKIEGLAAKYKSKIGKKVVWWTISSCTENVAVLENPTFLGQRGERVVFNIANCCCVKIADYSAIPEDEVLLLPGSTLLVKSVLDAGNGLHIVHLEQNQAEFLLDFRHPDLLASEAEAAAQESVR